MRVVAMQVLNRHRRALPGRHEAGDEPARDDADEHREIQPDQRDEPEANAAKNAHHGVTSAGSWHINEWSTKPVGTPPSAWHSFTAAASSADNCRAAESLPRQPPTSYPTLSPPSTASGGAFSP